VANFRALAQRFADAGKLVASAGIIVVGDITFA
jgi:hypothetical protein